MFLFKSSIEKVSIKCKKTLLYCPFSGACALRQFTIARSIIKMLWLGPKLLLSKVVRAVKNKKNPGMYYTILINVEL